jgi:flagellar motor switch protein FliN/FliY
MSDRNDEIVHAPKVDPLLRDLSVVHDVPLHVSIEVGRMKLSIKEFLRLVPGTVLEVKKPAGEPFEIALNGQIAARGEVIMVEQSSGVRVVEILKPAGLS